MKFNSQICTTREQSERLLALGLKKETADMFYSTILENDDIARVCWEGFWNSSTAIDGYIRRRCIPAWSLHRLIEIVCNGQTLKGDICSDIIFDEVIDCIEHEAKEGYFNKDYLEE